MTNYYYVRKPFVDETGKIWTVGQTFGRHTVSQSMLPGLMEFGFIAQSQQTENEYSIHFEQINQQWVTVTAKNETDAVRLAKKELSIDDFVADAIQLPDGTEKELENE